MNQKLLSVVTKDLIKVILIVIVLDKENSFNYNEPDKQGEEENKKERLIVSFQRTPEKLLLNNPGASYIERNTNVFAIPDREYESVYVSSAHNRKYIGIIE